MAEKVPRVITKDWVDDVAPTHGRTSCSDADLANASGGWTGEFDVRTGKKKIDYPRCSRCYLLDHVGERIDSLDFEVRVAVALDWKEK
jgi:hypothetical protein